MSVQHTGMTPSEAFAEWERLKEIERDAHRALTRPGKRLSRNEKTRREEVWYAADEAVEKFENDLRGGRLD